MKKPLLKSLEKILAFLARIYLFRTRPKIIGITWSVWKTSCRMLISQIFHKYLTDKRVYTSPKNFNSELGLVFSIFKIEEYTPWVLSLLKLSVIIFFKTLFSRKQYDILVLEYWVDHPWDMDFLLSIAKPHISVFTKLDKIHLEYFDSENGIADEKIKLLYKTKNKAFLNQNDDFCRSIFSEIKGKKSYFPKVKNYELQRVNGWIKSAFIYDKSLFTSNITWEENIQYIILWFEILQELWFHNIPKTQHLDLELQAGRFTIFQWIQYSILIDSSYNAWPQSMKKMIENTYFLRDKLFPDYKVWFILGDMRELWEISEVEHKKLYKYIIKSDVIFTVWEQMQALNTELQKNNFKWEIKNYLKSIEVWIDLREHLEKAEEKYILLFKWSQNTIFVEEALKHVLNNKIDEEKLVRQSKDWLQKKERFFK